jgi:hypothetical protein
MVQKIMHMNKICSSFSCAWKNCLHELEIVFGEAMRNCTRRDFFHDGHRISDSRTTHFTVATPLMTLLTDLMN